EHSADIRRHSWVRHIPRPHHEHGSSGSWNGRLEWSSDLNGRAYRCGLRPPDGLLRLAHKSRVQRGRPEGTRRGDPLNNNHKHSSTSDSVAATALAAPPGPPLVLTSFARLVAILCIAVGIGALVAWWLGKPLFSSLLPVSGTMKPNTALCFFLGGASLAGLLAHSRRATGGALTRCLAWAQPAAALL